MKRTILFLLSICTAGFLQARDIAVNPSTFKAEYEAAADGDVLVMASGQYAPSGLNMPAEAILTLRAAPDAEVVLNCQIGATTAHTNGGLIFEGIEITRGLPLADNYFISGDPGNIKILAFKGVTISNIGRCLLRTNTAGYVIDEILFEDCIIRNCGTGWNFLYPKHAVKKLSVRNSTLYNYLNGESFFCPNETYSTNNIEFLFENNTIYKWSGATNGRALAKVTNRYAAGSSYVFRNNIVAEHSGAFVPAMIDLSSGGSVVGEHNLVVNYGSYAGGTQSINDLSLAGLGLSSIGFPDPDNGDFTILTTSPLATAGTGGTCVGDPRWVKSLSAAVHFSSRVEPAGAGTVSPVANAYEKGATVTVTAAHNYGYRFKEWQSSGGARLSGDNPYTFIIEQDTELTAIFTAIPMHTLTVNKSGAGAEWGRFSQNPLPVNGEYEEGTAVEISIVPNSVTSFLYWEDMSTAGNRPILMDRDQVVTANFDVIPFLVAWNFEPSEPRNNRQGDFYSRSDNTGIMRFYNGDGSATNWGGSSKTWGGVTYACARRYTNRSDMSQPRYFQAEFSARGGSDAQYSNIRIVSYIGSDNACVHTIQKMQWATDANGPFTDLQSIDITPYHNSQWVECSATLPDGLTEAEKNRIYVRWIGDAGSPLLGTPADTDTEGFYLANVTVYADVEAVADGDAPRLVFTIPADGTRTASANGAIVLSFDEQVRAGIDGGAITFNGETIMPVFGNQTVSYAHKRLMYGTEYTVDIPAGVITDRSGNAFAGHRFSFRTMERPEPAMRVFDAVVDKDGTGDYTTVQAAINGTPVNRTSPWLIFVKNGRYEELLRIPNNKPYIHLIGEDREQVTLTWGIYCSEPVPGWEAMNQGNQGVSDACASMVIDASDFYAENISFENRYGVEAQSGPQALAFKNTRDRVATYNCSFRSYQDTWQTSSGANDRIYAYACRIEGAVDYFYNAGNALVENSLLYNVRSGSVIVAPSHPADTRYGYVFKNCTVDGNALAADGQQKLGRPWKNTPRAVYINTVMNIPIHPEGWTNMGVIPALFAEYNSVDRNGAALDLSNRKTCYTQSAGEGGQTVCGVQAVLSDEEAAAYTYEAVVGGTDEWNPRAFFEATSSPGNVVMSGGRLSWEASQYAICYVIYKNGRAYSFTTELYYEDVLTSAEDRYYVRAVNEYGSLGGASDVVSNDGVGIRLPENGMWGYVIERRGGEIVVRGVKVGGEVRVYGVDGRIVWVGRAGSDGVRISGLSMKGGVYIMVIDGVGVKVVV
jgi:pectin methylesterase-like acyl-CoA thioesterase